MLPEITWWTPLIGHTEKEVPLLLMGDTLLSPANQIQASLAGAAFKFCAGIPCAGTPISHKDVPFSAAYLPRYPSHTSLQPVAGSLHVQHNNVPRRVSDNPRDPLVACWSGRQHVAAGTCSRT